MNTNLCDAPTKNGTTCTHPVAYGSTHCAAGHVILPDQWGPEPTIHLSSNHAASMTGSIDMEDVLNVKPLLHLVKGELEVEPTQDETPDERRARLLQRLVDDTGIDPLQLSASGTVTGARKRLGDGTIVDYEVEHFVGGPDGSLHVAYGDLGKGKSWYYRSPCTHSGCKADAYIRIRKSHTWDPENPLKFTLTLAEAHGRKGKAKCPMHRNGDNPS